MGKILRYKRLAPLVLIFGMVMLIYFIYITVNLPCAHELSTQSSAVDLVWPDLDITMPESLQQVSIYLQYIE